MFSLSKKDKTGLVIIILCVFFFIGIGVIAIIVNNNKIELDENTLCPAKELPKGHTAILVDRTDPLALNQTEWLFTLVNKIKANLSVYEKLSIIPITKESEKFLNPIFSLCSPRQGNNANPFYENPIKLRKKFERQFGLPLKEVLDKLRKGETYDQSPIMESIQRLTESKIFSSVTENRKIIIVSDMLQNTGRISHYKGYSSDRFIESKHFNEIKSDLSNTDITIYYLASSIVKARKYQGERHKKFWEKFFRRSNVSSYSLIPVSKLDLENVTPASGETPSKLEVLNEDIVKKKLTTDQILSKLDQLGSFDTINKKGPSFNCKIARTWDEIVICSNQELSQLDAKLDRVYREKFFKIKNDKLKRSFADNQIKWLKLRNLCHREKNRTECLKKRMSSRIEWINQFNSP